MTTMTILSENATNDNYTNNSSDAKTHISEITESPESVVVPILFTIVFVVGVVGNGTLIFIVLRNKSMRNVPNIFVVCLSVGDLMLLLTSAPFSATVFTFTSWPYGEFMCKFNEFMQTVSVGVSVFTLTALSLDRYIAIVHPMSKHMGKPTLLTIVTVTVIWVMAVVFAIPDCYTSRLEYQPTTDNSTYIPVCVLYPYDFPLWYTKGHPMLRFVIFFLVPMIVIGLFYALMAKILILSSKKMPCEATKGLAMNQQQQRQIEARLKVAKVVLSFVVIFVICWLPRHIYLLWHYWSPSEYNMFWHVFKITGFCLTYMYSCVNPYALYFLSSQFRKYYNRSLFCCCPKARYNSLNEPTSVMYNFNSTMRRGSTSLTGAGPMHTQSMC
ncbi:hypothetical protein CHS0354_035934 [Potamilus streckersoni]|uniref:G-protein coupled receptors family 1 profile domain-containing protein n=1 Tax=Potamilus streckersoni TaxID=2493646 RepID=A0AAE0VV39_9BIVA|nr:hypothetical protein CHS0354_035934 [Potamilus streckersoni]